MCTFLDLFVAVFLCKHFFFIQVSTQDQQPISSKPMGMSQKVHKQLPENKKAYIQWKKTPQITWCTYV